MKIKSDYVLKNVAGQNIVLPTGAEKVSFNGVMTFNEVGAELFNLLDGSHDRDDLVKYLTDNFSVDADRAEADVDRFIAKLRDNGLLED
ncbi:MAG: PqqD family protein [Clostridiales bacterium]|nr:PqqD family protein [Clostridiales bacterium]